MTSGFFHAELRVSTVSTQSATGTKIDARTGDPSPIWSSREQNPGYMYHVLTHAIERVTNDALLRRGGGLLVEVLRLHASQLADRAEHGHGPLFLVATLAGF